MADVQSKAAIAGDVEIMPLSIQRLSGFHSIQA